MLKILDVKSEKGISWYFRLRRMKYFLNYLKTVDKEKIYILDLGGTVFFWEKMGLANSKKVQIVILNLDVSESPYENMWCVAGNVTDLNTFPKMHFDIVFSNSVIEHLFSYENQKKMASNILKFTKKFFIQTPNYYFPIEPHFIFPFFHYLPTKIKIFLISHFSLGPYQKLTGDDAQIAVEEIKLLNANQMKELFPESSIGFEKLLFFNKSIIAQNLF